MTGNRQAFATDEFQARLACVQTEMTARGLAGLLVHSPENIYYFTGYQTSGYFAYQVLIVNASGAPRLLCRYLERGNVDEYSWLGDADTWREGDDVAARTAEVVRDAGLANQAIGMEKRSWFLSAALAESLYAAMPASRFVDASQLIERVRLIKSPAEIAYLAKAAAIAEIEIRAAVAALREGTTEAEVAAVIHGAGIRAGCEYTGLPHHVSSGYRFQVGHANWSSKRIEAGELVRLELYGCVERYHATQVRTVAVGKPSQDLRNAAALVTAAQDNALALLKPGASSRAIDAVVRGPIRAIRPDYFNRTGYSTGIGFPPRTAEWDVLDFNEHHDWEVKQGMVFHMLAGAKGFGISETVVVTSAGSERLTATNPRELQFV